MSAAEPSDHSSSADLPGRSLPPVEAPTASFILQLFLIPLVIVSMVVLVWLMFSWMVHMGQDNPKTIIQQLRKRDNTFGQRAYELAELLRSPDPKFDALRSDPEICHELISLLEADLATPIEAKADLPRFKRRMFLCRAIGSFHISDGVPVLLRCIQESGKSSVDLELVSLEGIATLAKNLGPERIREEKEVLSTVLAASRHSDEESSTATDAEGETFYRPGGEVRAVAAYVLGVLAGPDEKKRLVAMLGDPYPNARYNAATGLARAGDVRCIPVVQEMLLPDNALAARDERGDKDKDNKRVIVLRNGIQTAVVLAQKDPQADLSPLKESLKAIVKSDLAAIKTDRSKLQIAAKEALRVIGKK